MPRRQANLSYNTSVGTKSFTDDMTVNNDLTVNGDLTVSGSISAPSIKMVAVEDIDSNEAAILYTTTDVLQTDATVKARVGHNDDIALAFPIWGNGVSVSSMKLNLSTSGADPGALLIQIVTKKPSGGPSEINVPNATAAITFASLTTSLVETTVNFAGSFTLTNVVQYYIVLKVGAFSSNGTKFYEVGTAAGIVTGYTRPATLEFDGVDSWGFASSDAQKPYTDFSGMHTIGAFKAHVDSSTTYLGFPTSTVEAGNVGSFVTEGIIDTTAFKLKVGSLLEYDSGFKRILVPGPTNIGFAISTSHVQLTTNDFFDAETINSLTPAVGTTVLSQSDSGKNIFLIAGAVDFTIPVIANLNAGWNVAFKATAVWTGTVTAQTAIFVGPITAAGLLENLSAQATIASGTVGAGDWFTVTFDGTNLLVAGTGTAGAYIT